MTDLQLIEKMRSGDRSAFGELYARHWESCVKYASLLVGSSQAEDIVQEIFMKVWRNRSTLIASESLRPYLLRSVYNSSLNLLRNDRFKETFRNRYALQIELHAATQYDPDRCSIISELFAKDTRSSIEDAIGLLPDRCQTIFRMSYIYGMPHKDIAKKLDISLSTVDNQIYKALKLIRTHIPKEILAVLVLMLSMEILR